MYNSFQVNIDRKMHSKNEKLNTLRNVVFSPMVGFEKLVLTLKIYILYLDRRCNINIKIIGIL